MFETIDTGTCDRTTEQPPEGAYTVLMRRPKSWRITFTTTLKTYIQDRGFLKEATIIYAIAMGNRAEAIAETRILKHKFAGRKVFGQHFALQPEDLEQILQTARDHQRRIETITMPGQDIEASA